MECAGFAVVPVAKERPSYINRERLSDENDQLIWVGQSEDIPHRVLLNAGFDVKSTKIATLGDQHYVVDRVLGIRKLVFTGDDLANPTDITLQPLADFPTDQRVSDVYVTYDAAYLKASRNEVDAVYRVDSQGKVAQLWTANEITIKPIDDYNDEIAFVYKTQLSNGTERISAKHFLKGEAVLTQKLPELTDVSSVQLSSLLDKNSNHFGVSFALHEQEALLQSYLSLDAFRDPTPLDLFNRSLNVKKWPDATGETKVWLNTKGTLLDNGDRASLAQFDIKSANNQIETQIVGVEGYDNTETILGMDSHSWLSAVRQDNGAYGLKEFHSRWYGTFKNDGWFNFADGHTYVQYRKTPANTTHRTEIITYNGWALVWGATRDGLERGLVSLINGNNMRPTKKNHVVFAGLSYYAFLNETLVVATPYLYAVTLNGDFLINHQNNPV